MNKPAKSTKDKPTKPNTTNKQRGFGAVGLLIFTSALNAAVVVGALIASKKPPIAGD